MNLYEIEMAILFSIWSSEKYDLRSIKRDMFKETFDYYDRIVKYREDGNPAGDVLVSSRVIGQDLTTKIVLTGRNAIEANIDHYITELSKLRAIEKVDFAIRRQEITKEILEEAVLAFTEKTKDGNLYSLSGSHNEYIEYLEKRIRKEVEMYNVGFHQLDDLMGGLELGDFFIVKALQKVGKTNFMINIFLNMRRKGIPCIYITSEMDNKQLLTKMIAIEGSISAKAIRYGNINEQDQNKVIETLSTKISPVAGNLYHTGMFSMSKISDLIDQTGAKVIFIDYLQKFSYSSDASKTESYEKIAAEIKSIGITKKVVMVCGSQVNENEGTKWCAGFDEGADSVVLLKAKDDSSPDVKIIDAIVQYNRYGSSGSVSLVLNKKSCRILEMDKMDVKSDYENKKMDWINK